MSVIPLVAGESPQDVGLGSLPICQEPQARLWTLTLGWGWRREGQASGPEAGEAEIPLVLVPGELPRVWGWEAGADREVNWAQRRLRLHLQLGGVSGLRSPVPHFPSL